MMEIRTDTPKPELAQNVLFMPSVYNDAMTLLHEAQDYFTQFGTEDQHSMDRQMRSLYTGEMSRITLRLSCIMSWLLAQRSVVAGEIDKEQSAHYGLEFKNICQINNEVLHGILPSYVCYLLDSTLELYERVLRLDSQIHGASKVH